MLPGCAGRPGAVCNAASLCREAVCEGIGYTCGGGPDAGFAWSEGAVACDDGDPCTAGDVCTGGKCAGTPRTCASPPAPRCASATTLEVFEAKGSCKGGACAYPSRKVACPGGCSKGRCSGDPCRGIRCDAPNTTGGRCVKGICTGYACKPGYANCNGDFKDGCEVKLGTASNCARCGDRCPARRNATATCSAGRCGFACKRPYRDCNKRASDGCEIPVGVPNQCDRKGLNRTTGCGTAVCGSVATGTRTQSFGTWSCIFCSHCHKWTDGWSWCLVAKGTFSADRCANCCSAASADKVCKAP